MGVRHVPFRPGTRFGRLTVVRLVEPRLRGGAIHYETRCDCGATVTVGVNDLRRGHTQSCGCLQKERAASHRTTHGQGGRRPTKTYRAWAAMKSRCSNPDDHTYPNYGGRGVSVHSRWTLFENFVADMGECPVGLTLERIDVNGNYEPGNCKWATWQEQHNNKRTNVFLEHDGLRLTVTQWAKRLGLDSSTVRRRLRQGMTVADALRPHDCRGHQRGSA